jgi:hypothetical protein
MKTRQTQELPDIKYTKTNAFSYLHSLSLSFPHPLAKSVSFFTHPTHYQSYSSPKMVANAAVVLAITAFLSTTSALPALNPQPVPFEINARQ